MNSCGLFNFSSVSQVGYDQFYLLFTLVFTAICMMFSSVLKPLEAGRKMLGGSMLFLNFCVYLILSWNFLLQWLYPHICLCVMLFHVLELNTDWWSFLQSVNVYMVSNYAITRTIFLILEMEILSKYKVLKQMLSTGMRQHR